ncbi:uncharacterized protein LOC135090090 isoform X2 [Scylla paramamosain]|uniref:uncharacterized protein LOC135090090 isoform X2 n=1 Tax=Scylla paramamosain TaxID=85552 RepID=UPI0030828C95
MCDEQMYQWLQWQWDAEMEEIDEVPEVQERLPCATTPPGPNYSRLPGNWKPPGSDCRLLWHIPSHNGLVVSKTSEFLTKAPFMRPFKIAWSSVGWQRVSL